MSVNGPKPRACDLNKCNTIFQQSHCTKGDGVKKKKKKSKWDYSLAKWHAVFKFHKKKQIYDQLRCFDP